MEDKEVVEKKVEKDELVAIVRGSVTKYRKQSELGPYLKDGWKVKK